MTTADIRPTTDALLKSSAVRRPANMGQILRWLLLFIGGVLMVMPIAYMMSTSLKWPHEVYNLKLIPDEPHLENYTFVLEDGRFFGWFWNSIIIATITTISNVLFDSLVGYALCKFRFPGRYIIFIAILSTLMIPTEMLVIPWYLMSQAFGWLDSYWGIMFPGLMTAFGTFLMKQFFETVPDDFIEAARIDGLNELQIWWTVAMPLVRPALAALAIFVFLGNWTAFIWPLIVTNSPETRPLTVGLSIFGAPENGVDISVISAATLMSVAPLLIAFLIFQRQFVQAFLRAGIK